MSANQNQGFFANIRYDLPASIVVFLVAMPLCLGIALASGAPLFSGVIAGIAGGIVVTLISGSALGVSGPAAGLAVIVLNAIHDLGAFETFLLAVVLAGLVQLVLGVLKAGVLGYYFPSSVIKGMLTGIGIIIIIKQIPFAFGVDKASEASFSFATMNVMEVINPGAALITAISMAILLAWDTPLIKRIPVLNKIQAPLLVVLAGIGLGQAFKGIPGLALSQAQLVNVPVSESITGFVELFTLPDFSQWNNPQVYVVAFTIAIVASLETLLGVEATDKLDPQKRITPTNRELIAQGAGNMVSGLIGGLPVTQVIVRSSANIQSGGRTKASAFMHGILLLISAMTIPQFLNMIPLASLAAILFTVGFKLARPAIFLDMHHKGRTQFIPFVVTVLGLVFTDMLLGIGLGISVATFHILWNNYKTPYHFHAEDYVKGETITIRLAEDVSFLNKASIMRTLHKIPDGSKVIIDASKTHSMHLDVMEIIDDFIAVAPSHQIDVTLEGMSEKQAHDPVEQFGSVIVEHPQTQSLNKALSNS